MVQIGYLQEVYFKDGTIGKTEFKDYSDWHNNYQNTNGLQAGPIGYDGEGGAYKTVKLNDNVEGYALFDNEGVCSTYQGTIGGHDTLLIFDYTHLKLWRKLWKDRPERATEFDEIEREYNEKIKNLRK